MFVKSMRKAKGKGVQILLSALYVFLICILVLIGLLMIYSPGKPAQFLDVDGKQLEGSISEKVFVNIGGVKQGMFIRGEDIDNPVLLFAHGGPCFSEYFLVEKYPTGIEEDFTVCYWEERGGGLSYSKDIAIESMTLEQLTADTIEVTNYLRDRFNKDKIYLMAHSGGTAFAMKAASEEPELFDAYIGIGQITWQTESEKLAYQYMLEEYQKTGNSKKVQALKEYPILESDAYVLPFFRSLLRDQSMHELGVGTMRNMHSVLTDVFIPVFQCKAYTLKEKINIWVSKFTFINKTDLAEQIFADDLPLKVSHLEVPVYFFSGAYDLTVNRDLSKKYLNQLDASLKGFYTFEQSAHSPIFEEPEKFKYILENDVRNGTVNLADTD